MIFFHNVRLVFVKVSFLRFLGPYKVAQTILKRSHLDVKLSALFETTIKYTESIVGL